MRTILITGSAGFIGSHLVERFLQEGNRVIGVDNYLSGQRSHTDRFLKHLPFSFLELDVSLGLDCEGDVDWVLHFASPASPPHYQAHPIETLMVGAQGTQNALELARRKGARFMLASTSEVYGDPLIHPQPETYWGNVNPNGLRSCYDEAKRYAEALTMAYYRTHDLDTRIIRIFNTYGPRMRADDGRVVTNFINQALQGKPLTVYGTGSQTRSFQYVSDLVDGIFRLMPVNWHQPVNLGNPTEYTIRRFAEVVRDLIDPTLAIVEHPMPADDPKQRRPDTRTAKALLDWTPTVSLAQGLAETIRHFQRKEIEV